jgi:hypothetical protein
MQAAWDERNVAAEAAFRAARRAAIERSFANGDADEIAAAEHDYDEKVDAQNAAVDAMIAAALSFAAATRALAHTGATRLACARLETAARTFRDEYERRYGSTTARRKVGDDGLKRMEAEFEAAYADVVASIRAELGLTSN